MNFLKNYIDKLFFNDSWQIGMLNLNGKALDQISNADLTWHKFTNEEYEADPFFLVIKEQIYILFESYSISSLYGKIKAFDFKGNEYDFFSEINLNGNHKSYPFIFYDDDEIYCLPEECEKKNLTLYKFNTNVNRFVFDRVILSGEEFIDTNIFKKNDLYFLSTSTKDKPEKQRVFWSKALNNKFVEHPFSPIKESTKYGRNGGFIDYKDSIYRVSQDFTNFYGEKISIFKIVSCSNSIYLEEKILDLDVKKLEIDYLGIHTLTNYKDYFLLDAKRKEFNLLNPFKKFLALLRKKLH